jgi:hypothetical protein
VRRNVRAEAPCVGARGGGNLVIFDLLRDERGTFPEPIPSDREGCNCVNRCISAVLCCAVTLAVSGPASTQDLGPGITGRDHSVTVEDTGSPWDAIGQRGTCRVSCRHRPSAQTLPTCGSRDGRGRAPRARLHVVPEESLAPDPLDEPARAVGPRDQATYQRSADLPSEAAIIRLVGALLGVRRRYMSLETSASLGDDAAIRPTAISAA